ADVRLDGAERIVLGRDAGLGQRVKEGGLADVRQADDAALQAISSRRASRASWSSSAPRPFAVPVSFPAPSSPLAWAWARKNGASGSRPACRPSASREGPARSAR